MNTAQVQTIPFTNFKLWEKFKDRRAPLSFDFEITARCNNDCRHCYINLPANAPAAKDKELSLTEIKEIVDEAVSLGTLWCLVTGGEPFLRNDFSDIYLYFKKRGLLVSVFTNATLIRNEHIRLFKKYPPRDIEISVYGVTQNTYERVTRTPGSFAAFKKGLQCLIEAGIKIRLKAMALRSNISELKEISQFCRQKSSESFRFDPFLHLRYDEDPHRNREIISERLSPEEITAIERSDPERFRAIEKECDTRVISGPADITSDHLFHCGTGIHSFSISPDGIFRLCPSLWQPDCIYDLKKGSLEEACHDFTPRIRDMHSGSRAFLDRCRSCPIINLCLWCPAHAHLETGKMDVPVDYFCRIAHARAKMIGR